MNFFNDNILQMKLGNDIVEQEKRLGYNYY